MVATDSIAPLTKIWHESDLNTHFSASTKRVVKYNGEPYAMPMSYYHWGIYYRKSMFEKWGISPPHSWEQLVSVIKNLKEQGLNPLNLSGASSWSSLSWFDYLTLRLLCRSHYPRYSMAKLRLIHQQ